MKRVYFPELKRIVNVNGSYLTLVHGVEGHSKDLHEFLMHIPFPKNCNRYEVRYRQSENGKYTAVKNNTSMMFYKGKRYINLACFIPESWEGKNFNRYVKAL